MKIKLMWNEVYVGKIDGCEYDAPLLSADFEFVTDDWDLVDFFEARADESRSDEIEDWPDYYNSGWYLGDQRGGYQGLEGVPSIDTDMESILCRPTIYMWQDTGRYMKLMWYDVHVGNVVYTDSEMFFHSGDFRLVTDDSSIIDFLEMSEDESRDDEVDRELEYWAGWRIVAKSEAGHKLMFYPHVDLEMGVIGWHPC